MSLLYSRFRSPKNERSHSQKERGAGFVGVFAVDCVAGPSVEPNDVIVFL
jgi:hypothetical protein